LPSLTGWANTDAAQADGLQRRAMPAPVDESALAVGLLAHGICHPGTDGKRLILSPKLYLNMLGGTKRGAKQHQKNNNLGSILGICYNVSLGRFKIADICAQASGWYAMAKQS
jgi:hypothetical protein